MSLPPGFTPFELGKVRADRSEVAWGTILLNHFRPGESWASALDGCARPVWWQQAAPDRKIARVRADRAGGAVRYSEYQRDMWADQATLHRQSVDDPEDRLSTRMLEQHHDWVLHDDGTVAFISWQSRENTWFEDGAPRLAADAIRTTTEGEKEPIDQLVLSLFDDLGLDPWWTCKHMRQGIYLPLNSEWTHANSLVLDSRDQAYYLLVRYWDAVIKLSVDGDVEWILGGPLNQFTLLGDTQLPSHGHMSEAWRGGMLVFDNGDHEHRPSRVVEYAIDERARTVREVWSYTDPQNRFTDFLGDARRLPGGNVLISWTAQGHITEVTRAGRIVWEATTVQRVGRLEFVPKWPPP